MKALKPEPVAARRKVLLVDDHPIVRRGMAQLIGHESDLCVSAEASDADEALSLMAKDPPDVLVVDISLRKTSGMDLARTAQTQFPDMPVLILSMHEESLYAERALRAGARGYVMKAEAPGTLLKAIREVLRGGVFVSENIASRLLRRMVGGGAGRKGRWGVESLSDRELEVFELLGRGLSSRAAADQMKVGIKTVETYRRHIKQKLGLNDAAELVQRAIQWVNDANSK